MNEKFNKNAKVNQLTETILSCEGKKGLIVKDPLYLYWVEFELLVFYVTCNDVSVIYVTAQNCRQTEEEVVPTVGLPTP